MKTIHTRASCALLLSSLFVLAGCEGGSAGDRDNRGDFVVTLISTGQGQIYPYRIRQSDSQGQPTTTILNVESEQVLRDNASSANAVLPVAAFPTTAVLPDGSPGNQFVLMRFSHKLDVTSILSDLLANATTNSGLTTSISLLAYDPNTETTTTLEGRGFVAGYTYFNRSGTLELVQAVEADGDNVTILDPEASGFPVGFNGDEDLVQANSFVFIADRDGDLDTFETFDPLGANTLLRLVVSNAVRDTDGAVLEQEVCSATTVGADPNPADVLGFSSNATLQISPGNGDNNVDPTTPVTIRFNKPVQPTDVGAFFEAANLTPTVGGVALSVNAAAQTFNVIYYADPLSFGDLCNYRVTPAYTLPGESEVTVAVNSASVRGLNGDTLGNDVATSYNTSEGPGIVNAPVAPDAIYVGIGGADPGVAVIDVNGYGQGTSSVDPLDSNFATNPNIGQPGVVPALAVGSSSLDAGSRGRFTLVEDTSGNVRLLGQPLIGSVGDIHVGAPLDLVFNNTNVNINASSANQINPGTGGVIPGNSIVISPHPNPPKLIFPPPNASRAIFGEEPTVASSTGPPPPAPASVVLTVSPPCRSTAINQLTPGSRLDFGQHYLDGIFFGPQPPPESPPPPPPFCPFTSRQQIGHFLYVLDRENNQILVVNSNRFTVLDTIRLTDPFSLAMSPTLGVLACTNFASSSVSFIDADPTSPNFNTVISETRVSDGPTAVAWQPDGETILVTCEIANTLVEISAGDYSVRNEASSNLAGPFDIVVTERYFLHGNASGVYYAYVLNRNGTVAVYESGPDGPNGIGFNDFIGTTGQTFPRATSITLDGGNTGNGGFYISHVDDSGLGQVSQVQLTSSPVGQLPTSQILGNGLILPPTFRNKEWTVTQTFGGLDPTQPQKVTLSGNAPSDVAFDNMFNNAYLPNQFTQFNGGLGTSILGHSAKGNAFVTPMGVIVVPYNPSFVFIALADVGKIDVFDLGTRARVATIDVPGVTVLSHYWRQ